MAARRRRKVTWPIVNKDDIPLRSVIEEYLQYHDGLNHSPKTVRWYSDMLGRFADALGPEARTRDIDAETVRRYLRSVRANGFSKFTVHA